MSPSSSVSLLLFGSTKRRRSGVSWMVECSPHITLSRGSSGSKVRRSLSRVKTDLDGMFDDIPLDGSPLTFNFIKNLNISAHEPSPFGLSITPTPLETKDSTKDDNICTNLLSLLVSESPEKEEYHTPMATTKHTFITETFYTPIAGSPKPTMPECPQNDISTPEEPVTKETA